MTHETKHKEDAEIVELYWQRDESALAYTKQKYEPLCASISGSILHNTWDVEECLNDMYVATWNTIPPQKPDSLKMYVCKLIRRISINKATYNHADKRDRRKTVSFEEIEVELQQCCEDEWLTDDQACLTNVINRYLSRISEKRRAVLVLRFWHSMSLSEISQRTGLNINTVKTILAREMQSMKQFLIKEGVYHDE